MLREKQAGVEQKLAEFVRVARLNDQIGEKLHKFTRRIVRARTRAEVLAQVEASLREDFDAFHSTLLLVGPPSDEVGLNFVRTCTPDDARLEVLRHAVRHGQAPLRPGARFAARAAVRV